MSELGGLDQGASQRLAIQSFINDGQGHLNKIGSQCCPYLSIISYHLVEIFSLEARATLQRVSMVIS